MTVGTPVVVSPQTPSTPIVNSNGQMPYEWIKFFQNSAQAINNALTLLGEFNGTIGPSAHVAGHVGTLADNIQNLTAAGQLDAAHLTGIVPPAQLPAAGLAAIGAVQAVNPTAHKWVDSISPAGVPNLSQPAFADVSGAATPGQVPALSALAGAVIPGQVPALSSLTGAITSAQLPPGLFSGTIVTAQLTTLGAQGSMTFFNGSLVSQVAAT